MSEIKVNKISPKQTCTTVTLGDSGDTFIIPSGVTITNNGTQTGFGRTGTVDWDTTAKTASFTAVSGEGYFVNTTSGAITLTLPATPSAGDIVAFKDYAFTFATNNLTVDGNGSPIGGVDGTILPTYSTNGTSKTFIYVDGTKGWLVTNESTDTSQESNAQYITATGGTILTCGDFKTHVFTGPGTFTVCSVGNPAGSNSVEYVVVAAGGGGGGFAGGGGGAGGFRQNFPSPTTAGLPVSVQGYPITVGSGGAGSGTGPNIGPQQSNQTSGNPSIFSTITSTGGGKAATNNSNSPTPVPGGVGASPGGSGGGGSRSTSPTNNGTGNSPPTSPSQGNNGGLGYEGPPYAGGGGGGAGAVGENAPSSGGAGGVGSPIATTLFGPTSPSYGTPGPAPGRYFAGGGGGGINGPGAGGAGGSGGGGAGSNTIPVAGGAGTVNTGGGGGSGGNTSTSPCTSGGGAGGSGIVLIRYKFQ
jgi:hypothetical protein